MTEENFYPQNGELVDAGGGPGIDIDNRHAKRAHSISGLHRWVGGSSVASASSVTPPDNENRFTVTGTTTIAGFANKDSTYPGMEIKVTFVSALTLTHSATFIMPYGLDYNVTAGEVIVFQESIAGTYAFVSSSTVQPSVGVGAYSNLIVKRASVTQVDIDADFVTLWNVTDSIAYQAATVNLTVAITTIGVNGLDVAPEAVSTWYFLYAIYNPTTNTTAGLMSVSATAPTMPSGYTFKKLVGTVRNDGAGNLVNFLQYGNKTTFVLGVSLLSGGASGTYSALSPVVPSNATEIAMSEECASAAARFDYSIDGANAIGQFEATAATTRGFRVVPLNSSQQFYYIRPTGAGTLGLIVGGYTINL